MRDQSPIVFFDGVCNLCNSFVDFLIKRDSKTLFAPLQGLTASHKLSPELTRGLPSVVYIDARGRVYTHSAAAIRAIAGLGGLWAFVKVFLVVPEYLRNLIYKWVAANRYGWFGKRQSCRLPTPEERVRFLD